MATFQANNIRTPQIAGRVLNAFTAGKDARRKTEQENALKTIGQTAGGGDLAGARDQALSAGQFDTAGQLESIIDKVDDRSREAIKLFNEDVTRAAFNADTPEKWEATLRNLKSKYPSRAANIDEFEGRFDRREEMIQQGLSIDQVITRAEGGKPVSLSRGSILVDPKTGKEVARGLAPEPKAPRGIKNVVFPDGRTRAFREDDQRLDQALEEGATVIGQNVQAGSVAGLTGNRPDDLREEIGAISAARGIVADLRNSINENRSRGGAVGTIKGLGQTALGITLDVAEALNFEGSNIVVDAARDLNRDIQQGAADAGVSRIFDPTLPENKVRQNALAYALARARKGSGRLNQDDVENARRDVKITGATSVDDVLARLSAIEEELSGAETRFKDRLGGQTPGEVPVFEVRDGVLVRAQ